MTNRRSSSSSSDDTTLAVFSCLGLIFGSIMFIPIIAVINGFVGMYLWNSLLVPVFENLPVLTWQLALGVSFAITYFTNRHTNTNTDGKDEDTATKIANILGKIVFAPLFYVFIAWVISTYLY